MDKAEIDKLLDSPATGSDGQLTKISGPHLGDQADTTELDGQAAATSSAENEDVGLDDEPKVPKSRFRKTREELIEAKRALAKLDDVQRELDALKSERRSEPQINGDSTPDWWIELYGDSDESIKGYKTYRKGMLQEREELRTQLKEEQQREERERKEFEEAVSDQFDDQLEELEETTGKKFKDSEASALLDIVAEYSPTAEDGSYVSYISLNKAYEIYEMKQTAGRGNRGAKDRLARIANISSQGESSAPPAPRAPQWGDWTRRLGG